jgi:hypothetical protein
VEDRSQNIWENFMKLNKTKLPVFTNMSINPVFKILNDDRLVYRSCFTVHICPSPIKQTTLLTHIPLIDDTFPIHFNKFEMAFGRANVFRVQKSNHQMHLTISWISDSF